MEKVLQTSSKLVRWGGLAAMLGGALLVVKGGVIIVSAADPSFVPPATLLFALGMVGLHARLEGRGGLLGRIGVLLARVVVAASVVNLIGLALPVPTPGDPGAPVLLEITYMTAFLGILIGLLLLGIVALRAEVLNLPWRAVPLAVGVLWFPLQGVGLVISDGVGLILGGLAWMLLGYVLWSDKDSRVPKRSRTRTTPPLWTRAPAPPTRLNQGRGICSAVRPIMKGKGR